MVSLFHLTSQDGLEVWQCRAVGGSAAAGRKGRGQFRAALGNRRRKLPKCFLAPLCDCGARAAHFLCECDRCVVDLWCGPWAGSPHSAFTGLCLQLCLCNALCKIRVPLLHSRQREGVWLADCINIRFSTAQLSISPPSLGPQMQLLVRKMAPRKDGKFSSRTFFWESSLLRYLAKFQSLSSLLIPSTNNPAIGPNSG